MQMRRTLLVAILCYSFWTMSSAEAETISFSGRVDTVPEPLMPTIQPEMTITGFYTFDESLAVSDFLSSVTDFQMVIGDYSVAQDPTAIRGDISLKPNEFTVVSIASGNVIAGEFTPLLMALQLGSSSAKVDTTSPIPPPIEDFDNPLWTLDFSSTGLPIRVAGTIETLQVPEPSPLWLLATGALCVGPLAVRGAGRRDHSRKPNRR